MNIPDHISKSLETIFLVKILKFFDADPGIFLTRDPGWKKLRSGMNIPDPQHCPELIFPLLKFQTSRIMSGLFFSRVKTTYSLEEHSAFCMQTHSFAVKLRVSAFCRLSSFLNLLLIQGRELIKIWDTQSMFFFLPYFTITVLILKNSCLVFEARYSEMEWMINKNVDKDGSEQETDFVSTVPVPISQCCCKAPDNPWNDF